MVENQISARTLETLLGQWRGGASAYVSLSERIRLLTLDGRIATDSRLPAERDLSTRLAVSRTTVAAAYRQLREAGYLHSVRGSGSVTRLPSAIPGVTPAASDGVLDFSKATMPALPGLADAARHAAAELPRHLGDSGFDPVGLPELRAAIADRYAARGVPTTPEQIMVTIGAQHAISLLSRVLLSRGDRALIENPTYPHAAEALRSAGARLVGVNVSAGGPAADAPARGWDEIALLQTLQRSSPALGYLMPDFHNPTGESMPVLQRERVIAAAARSGTVLIADETIAELSIDRAGEFAPFAACVDARDQGAVVSIGSVGKSVWGGIRIGWIRAEPALIRKLVSARSASDLGTPLLEQLIVSRLLADMPGILSVRAEQLRAGRDHLESRLAETFPDWHIPHVDGGITAWVNLGSPVSSQLALAARNHGLIVPAGPIFGIDGAFERFMRIPFMHSVDDTDRAVDALALAWASLARHPISSSGSGSLAEVV
ncbi:PLP-dependent aminotransferase family protein [Cryobacterium psychrophilum]|uniref:PLP-dependent aminotransferase family protein n=1 Tax=Cryobacterium psychrophilum TaxID=41988 RepID=A0A4Y8KIM9_9MICO|nr:PLP-dependent aminotransferase family protein [Cryobacterium psychrophilum]TDW30011.1 GntR family transcriptional regulator [Cryobacterium psychrophilum]TFD75541.1 PLP-dependent aminotransferase family protein [Cryobacterium psychrophilum]